MAEGLAGHEGGAVLHRRTRALAADESFWKLRAAWEGCVEEQSCDGWAGGGRRGKVVRDPSYTRLTRGGCLRVRVSQHGPRAGAKFGRRTGSNRFPFKFAGGYENG